MASQFSSHKTAEDAPRFQKLRPQGLLRDERLVTDERPKYSSNWKKHRDYLLITTDTICIAICIPIHSVRMDGDGGNV